MGATIPSKGSVKTPGGYDAVVQAVMLVDTDGNYAGAGGGGGGASTDRELVVTQYTVTTAFTGASVGDRVVSVQVLDVSGASPTTVATLWRNQSTGTDLASQPSSANLSIVGSTGLTNAQLRAAPVPVSADSASPLAVSGNVASGAADAGNPVKVGGIVTTGNVPAMTSGIRSDLILSPRGGLVTQQHGISFAMADGQNNAAFTNARPDGLNIQYSATLGYNFNGTSWDRQRGDTNGTWITGNIASGQPDAGSPVKIGGVYNTTQPAASGGQRIDFQSTTRGEQLVSISNGAVAIVGRGSSSDAAAASATASNLSTFGYQAYFNGTTWDRQRGDTSGAYNAAVSFFTESSTPLASAGSISGSLRSSGGVSGGVGSRFNFFVAEAFADQSGTLYIDKSVDGGTTWRQVGSIAAVAGTSVSLKVPVTAVSYRSRFVNGATAQTAFLLTSSFASA